MHSPLLRVTAELMTISFCLTAPLHARHKNSPTSAISQAETDRPKTIVDQSISGDVYSNGAGRFTLTVPEGWRTNDDIVEPKLGIGGLSSPDYEAQLVIQQMPTEDDSPTTLAKKFDAKESSVVRGYRKLSESKLNVAGRNCEVLTFAWVKERKVAGASIDFKLVSRLVLMPNEYTIFAFEFVTREALFDEELPIFDQILKSFHSTAKEDFSPKPK
jgi:hypothetical protein